jgi:hypothetical protein
MDETSSFGQPNTEPFQANASPLEDPAEQTLSKNSVFIYHQIQHVIFIWRKGAAVLLCEKASSKGKPTKGYTTKQKYNCVLLLINDKS